MTTTVYILRCLIARVYMDCKITTACKNINFVREAFCIWYAGEDFVDMLCKVVQFLYFRSIFTNNHIIECTSGMLKEIARSMLGENKKENVIIFAKMVIVVKFI